MDDLSETSLTSETSETSVTMPLHVADKDEENEKEKWCKGPACMMFVVLIVLGLMVLGLALAARLENLTPYGDSPDSDIYRGHLFNFQPRCPNGKIWFRGSCRELH